MHLPIREGQRIVTRACLCLCGLGDLNLEPVRSDEVDCDIDLVLLGPGIDLLRHHFIGLRNPVVPKANVQLAGRTGGADMDKR